MIQALSALGTDAEVIKCVVMLVRACDDAAAGTTVCLLDDGGFTLAVAMCFPRFRATATAAAVGRGYAAADRAEGTTAGRKATDGEGQAQTDYAD